MAKRDTLNAVFLCPRALPKARPSVCDLRFLERMVMKPSVVWDVTPCSLAEM
jgi:hypothetical protein